MNALREMEGGPRNIEACRDTVVDGADERADFEARGGKPFPVDRLMLAVQAGQLPEDDLIEMAGLHYKARRKAWEKRKQTGDVCR